MVFDSIQLTRTLNRTHVREFAWKGTFFPGLICCSFLAVPCEYHGRLVHPKGYTRGCGI